MINRVNCRFLAVATIKTLNCLIEMLQCFHLNLKSFSLFFLQGGKSFFRTAQTRMSFFSFFRELFFLRFLSLEENVWNFQNPRLLHSAENVVTSSLKIITLLLWFHNIWFAQKFKKFFSISYYLNCIV